MIYFIQEDIDGPIKIGRTMGSAYVRMGALQCCNPRDLYFIGCVYGGFQEEVALHKLFKSSLIRGEWFNPTPELIDYIRTNGKNHDVVLIQERVNGDEV